MTCHIDNYTEFETENGVIYIKDDAINKLSKVDTIVFDCDGVLIDVRNAYNVAIAATTQFIIEALTGNTIPNNLFDSELNHAFKRTGGGLSTAHRYLRVSQRFLTALHLSRTYPSGADRGPGAAAGSGTWFSSESNRDGPSAQQCGYAW